MPFSKTGGNEAFTPKHIVYQSKKKRFTERRDVKILNLNFLFIENLFNSITKKL